jgi:hypothetical protein
MKALKIIAVLLVATFLYYKFAYPTYTYRYRMTAEVETPEGLKTGSSVVEINTAQWPECLRGLFGGHTSNTKIKGEGSSVEIDKGKFLFVLLESHKDVDHAKYILAYAAPMENADWSNPKTSEYIWNSTKTRKGIKYYGTLKNAKGELPEQELPSMIAVIEKEGLVDVKEVTSKNMADVFGKGVVFKGVSVETTEDSVEWKLEKMPVWSKIKDYMKANRNSKILPYRNKLMVK